MMVGPLREGGRSVEVAVVAEGGIRHQPLLALLKELLEGFCLHRLSTFLGINLAQIVHLGVVHTLVVYLWQGVQLFLQGLKRLTLRLIFQLWQLAQVSVLRMQGIDADAIVGI